MDDGPEKKTELKYNSYAPAIVRLLGKVNLS